MITGGFVIKVTTEELKSKSDIVKTKTEALKSAIEDARQLVSGTSSYWIGSAGDKKRKDFAQKKEKTDEMVKRMSEYVTDLMQMAGIYEEAEKDIADDPASLPMDVIL